MKRSSRTLLAYLICIFIISGCLSACSSEGDGSGAFSPAADAGPAQSVQPEPDLSRSAPSQPAISQPAGEEEAEPASPAPLNDRTYTEVYDVPAGIFCPAETLTGRAPVAVRSDDGILVSWRSFGDEDEDFILMRGEETVYVGKKTCYLDTAAAGMTEAPIYTLYYAQGDILRMETAAARDTEYIEFALCMPEDTILPNNHHAGHHANDMSVGDLDGDGELELIVKWESDESNDNGKDGWTGTTVLDAYDLDMNTGTAALMWRIDLGINIRSGAHYTQYQVWDYDGDGRAELLCKTSDGTTTYDRDLNETGHVGAVSMSDLNPNLTRRKQEYDYRETANGIGRIVTGSEYLTAFDGLTGEIIDTVDYVPNRGPVNSKGVADISSWGDTYANRSERYLAATAYIDDGTPAAIFARGYYSRTAITAWKLINDRLTLAWYFDAPGGSPYSGQGNHGLSVNDVDNDGYDEIIYGSLVMDHDGSVLYTTGLGHGDAMHVSDWNDDGRLEVFQVHENGTVDYQIELHDAETGEIYWGVKTSKDTGRGMAADIDPRYPGAEMWAAANLDTFDCMGNVIYPGVRPSINFSIFWDGDLLMELFDYDNQTDYTPEVQKWDWNRLCSDILLSAKGATTSNGTKGNAGLIADICGDWREEIILRCTDNPSHIRLYSTPIPTDYVIPCLLTDRAYREGVAWQNTAYNQPANLTVLLSGRE